MAATTSRLDGLSEVTELERIPLPYKTLYHTLVFKTEMPIELLKERHQTGSAQLLTWIKAASTLVQTIVDSQQQQRQKQREAAGREGKNQTKPATTTTAHTTTESTEKEEEDEDDLQEEIQDVVSGFGQYEPTIESSIEILLQLEECITERTSNSSTPLSNAVATGQHQHLSAEIETILEQWSRLRCIIGELTGSVREHQRLRDGIQSIDSIWEQTRQAIGILDRCVEAIEQDKRRTSQLEKAQSPTPGTPVPEGSGNHSPSSPRPLAVDSNDMLELESRIGLLGLQISTLQKSFPECTRSPKSSKALIKSRSKNSKVIDREPYSISDKKYHLATLYRGLLVDWNSLRSRKDQLWHDLEECDRWRTRVEKMALQIETMLEPVEIFYKLCVNLLESLDCADQNDPTNTNTEAEGMTPTDSVQDLAAAIAASSTSVNEKSRSVDADAIDMETLWSTLQELEEKQTTVAPAIENMFWVQDGEFQTRSAGAAVPASPTAAAAPPSPSSVSEQSAAVGPERSPLYPSLEMVERHRHLKDRWSNLKLSLDNVGTNLQGHHTRMKDQATETRIKKSETSSEDKMLVGSSAGSTPSMRRSTTSGPSKSVTMPPWNSSTRILRGKLVSSMSMDSNVVRKFMLVKSEKPVWAKPRPWCPSARTSSPGMPGFPQQTATWGYYLISKSQSMDSVGRVIAAPAPPLVPRLTLPPPSKISPQSSPKDKRPPFLPGGGSRSQSFNKQVPPPPVKTSFHTRSFSVAGGELGSNRGDKKGSSRSTKTGSGSKSNPTSPTDTGNGPFGPQGANASNKRGSGSHRTGSSRHKNSASQQGHHGSGHGASHSQGGHSKGNHHSLWRHTLDHLHHQDSSSASASSSEDDTIDGLGLMKGIRHASFNKHKHPAMNTSTSSLDSMLSSCNSSSFGAGRGGLRHYGSSSVSSSHGARSPSPYTPAFFGSSMAAARSTAALHTALLTSMTTSSPSSRCSSAYSARSESRVEEQRQQQRISDAVAATSASASTWMSMNAGSLISALSFTVPTYSNFDEDFGSFASLEETVATM